MPELPKRIVLIAGEESGDAHAAALVRELRSRDSSLQFSGIGGKHMEAAGVTILCDLAKHGVTGFTEVLRHAGVIRCAFKTIKAHLKTEPTDLLILIDYPGFNLRMARYAKQRLGLRVFCYISPQVWAWKAGRIETIRQNVDHMAVILPFEKAIYEQAGVPVSFVGHPLSSKVKPPDDIPALREKLGIPGDVKVVALLPGSRGHEIDRHLPVMRDAFLQLRTRFPDLQAVIPVAQTVSMDRVKACFAETGLPVHFLEGQALDAAGCADAVVVASGTASLECALLLKPMCIVYKASFVTYLAVCALIRVRYLGLCNLLAGKMIVPELLQYDCNPTAVAEVLTALLTDSPLRSATVRHLQTLRDTLSASAADGPLADTVMQAVYPQKQPNF